MKRDVDSLTLDELLKLQQRVICVLGRQISPEYCATVIKAAVGQAMQELLDEAEASWPRRLPSTIEVQAILDDMSKALGMWIWEMRAKR
jgi:hypothetical protein